MPLKVGSSPQVVSQNIREFHTGKTYAKTAAKFGKKRADKQAVAVALSTARKYGKKKANGGGTDEAFARGGMPHFGGMINSVIPGRTDKIPLRVPSGSYVLPADIPSAIGQGNTQAGAHILGNMFKIGPYGSGATGAIRAGRPTMPGFNWMRSPRMPMMERGLRMGRLARGGTEPEEQTGNEDHVPIIAAGGEMIIPPHAVREAGNGSIKAGHKVLDAFVLRVRKKNIETLKKLKPPKQ